MSINYEEIMEWSHKQNQDIADDVLVCIEEDSEDAYYIIVQRGSFVRKIYRTSDGSIDSAFVFESIASLDSGSKWLRTFKECWVLEQA